jgi:hypothetical protein
VSTAQREARSGTQFAGDSKTARHPKSRRIGGYPYRSANDQGCVSTRFASQFIYRTIDVVKPLQKLFRGKR